MATSKRTPDKNCDPSDTGEHAVVPPSARPWRAQDSVGLAMLILFVGLFGLSVVNGLRTWTMLQDTFARYQKEYEDLSDIREAPEMLINALENRRETAERNLEQLRERLADRQTERNTGDARLAARELAREKSVGEVNGENAALKQLRDQCQRYCEEQVRDFAVQEDLPDLQLDLTSLMRNGPGPEPDPFGPNGWRMEWREWELKSKIFNWAHDRIAPVEARLQTLTAELRAATTAYNEAMTTLEQIRKDINNTTAKLAEQQGELDAIIGKLAAIERSFTEPDPRLIAELEALQARIRENEATRAALFIMDLPTIGALLLASVSAAFRLTLLRDRFQPRDLAKSR